MADPEHTKDKNSNVHTVNDGDTAITKNKAATKSMDSEINENLVNSAKTASGQTKTPITEEGPGNDRNGEGSILQSFEYSTDQKITCIDDSSNINKIIQDLDDARRKGSFCDVTLVVGPEKHEIKAHRLMLSSASEYFKTMFTTGFKEASQSKIELPETDLQTMSLLIDFAYTAKTEINGKNIEKIAKTANYFGMTRLLQKCAEYIVGEMNARNCIEILEFAERISNAFLKDFAMNYFIQNFDEITAKNLDILAMSPSLLLEIIRNDATSIHQDPTENEERLFQLGWNYMQSKSRNIWNTFLPQLLTAVHLPVTSDVFLNELERKMAQQPDMKTLIEKAKHYKSETINYEPTTEKPIIDNDLRWRMKRLQKSTKLSVTCDNIIRNNVEDEHEERYSEPVFLNGNALSLHAEMQNYATFYEEGERYDPDNYFEVNLWRLAVGDRPLKPIKIKYTFELVPKKKLIKTHTVTVEGVFTGELGHDGWGEPEWIHKEDLLKNFHDKDSDSCTVIAHVSISDVIPEKPYNEQYKRTPKSAF